MTDDYKSETKRTYDTYPERFDEKFGRHFFQYVQPEADRFIRSLSGKKILDLGSGPGNHAAYFQEHGLDVLCVDLSEAMVEQCRRKGLSAIVADIETLDLEEQFDGIWAYASLLHIPKETFPIVINNIIKHLKPNGLLALALKEGIGEGFETHESYPETKRWFTYFTDAEIKELFGRQFDILYADKTEVKGGKYVFLKYLLRLK